jgi:hypothetical protein
VNLFINNSPIKPVRLLPPRIYFNTLLTGINGIGNGFEEVIIKGQKYKVLALFACKDGTQTVAKYELINCSTNQIIYIPRWKLQTLKQTFFI